MTTSFVLSERLLSLREVASYLHVSPLTVRRLVERGELAAYRAVGRLRFAPGDIAELLKRKKTNTYARPQD